jgi:hypothetical protein
LHPTCTATLTEGDNGEIVYKDATLGHIKREFQTIPELVAAIRTGKPERLGGMEHAIWRLRLLHDCGLVDLPLVDVPDVSPGSSHSLHLARDGFELLLRCRRWLDQGEPVAFTREFVSAWCGVPEYDTRQAIKRLREQEVIVKVGEIPNPGRKPTFLYMPGPGPNGRISSTRNGLDDPTLRPVQTALGVWQ